VKSALLIDYDGSRGYIKNVKPNRIMPQNKGNRKKSVSEISRLRSYGPEISKLMVLSSKRRSQRLSIDSINMIT